MSDRGAVVAAWGAGISGLAVLLGLGLYWDGFNGAEADDLARGATSADLLYGAAFFFYLGLVGALLGLGVVSAHESDGGGRILRQASFAVFVSAVSWAPEDPSGVGRWNVWLPLATAVALWIPVHLVMRTAEWLDRRAVAKPGSLVYTGPSWPLWVLPALAGGGVSFLLDQLVTVSVFLIVAIGGAVGFLAGTGYRRLAMRLGQAAPAEEYTGTPVILGLPTSPLPPPAQGPARTSPLATPTGWRPPEPAPPAGPARPARTWSPGPPATPADPVAPARPRARLRWSERTLDQRIAIIAVVATLVTSIAQIVTSFLTAR
ncbi:hypothetical protein AB0M43_20130 [Longispora sp. NPDC051575]|uniref:hypothetical protein n=1 Tax=Longispora sp. NPDC051575 TaxID=3154943 RepID=UPI0034407190